MKHKFFARRAPAPPVLAVVALLLTVGVVATMPFTWAKYTATATATTGSARVAKWNIYYHTEDNTPGGLWSAGSTAYLGSDLREGPGLYRFCAFSNSEVAANVKLEIRYETSDGTVLPAAVTATSPLFATISVTDTAVAHGLSRATLGYGDWGRNNSTRLGAFEFEFEPNYCNEWNKISTQPILTAPSGVTLNNCMRSYKVFLRAEQKD